MFRFGNFYWPCISSKKTFFFWGGGVNLCTQIEKILKPASNMKTILDIVPSHWAGATRADLKASAASA